MRYILVILVGIAVLGCKSDKQLNVKQLEGKYVASIQNNAILFEDKTTYEFPKDELRTYFLIRHAEKDTQPKGNPILTQKGLGRSVTLADIFKGSRVDEVYSTLTNRTFQTVDSLTSMKGLSTMIYVPNNIKEKILRIDSLAQSKRIVIVGHSNSTPVVANYLARKKYYEKAFDESDYDNFVVVHQLKDSTAILLPLKFRSNYE